jgi:hypothetical protein
MTPEGKVKKYLRDECKKRGWLCVPTTVIGLNGWPDRLILANGGFAAFVEVKAEGASLNTDHVRTQQDRLADLRAYGFTADLVRGKEGVDTLLTLFEKVSGRA